MSPALSRAVIEKFYVNLLGETFLKKGSPPDPFPKTLSIKSTTGLCSPVVDFKLKFFRREFEKTFFKRVFLNRFTQYFFITALLMWGIFV